MPLNVLQLGPYPPPVGGITRNIISIRDELRRRGHSCSIIATSRSSSKTHEPGVHHPGGALGLLFRLITAQSDVVHIHIGGDVTPRVLALAFVCTVAARRSVLTLHSGAYPLTEKGRNASARSLRGMIFRRFSRIVAINEQMADLFGKYGVPEHRISLIPPFSLAPPDRSSVIPDELTKFFSDHGPIFVAVGGLESAYDPLFLITSMASIQQRLPNAGLMIVGGGPLRPEAERAIANAGLWDHIHLSGSIDHDVALHLIAKADAMVRSSLFDGDAISVREALFLGTPVVATDTGNRPEGVRLFNIGDEDGFVDQLCAAASCGRKYVSVSEADSSNIAAVVDLYEDLVQGPRRHSR